MEYNIHKFADMLKASKDLNNLLSTYNYRREISKEIEVSTSNGKK
jgi:hypothetical protein